MRTAGAMRIFLVAALLAAPLAHAGDAGRPRVGLVLGGGGARGAAHIGVLEVLDKLRVPVDCVAGTSMGALVSGAFASGLSPSAMRDELAKADWGDMFQDNPAYSEVNFRKKSISRRFMPGSEIGVSSGGVAYQGGVVAGQKIKLFFNRLVNSDLGERNIESLPLPLSILATDIGSGERVVLREGSLTKAMRASMSVPGLMAPVDHQGRKLVDGGLVDNLPIDEARERCRADVVIVVNVGSPLMKAEDVGSLLTVSVQMVNILTEQNVSRSLARLKPADIYIKPDLNGITAGDFQKSSETADRGKAAAELQADRLKALSVSEQRYQAWLGQMSYVRAEAPVVHEVEISGTKWVNAAVVERYLQIRPGDRMDDARLNQDMLRAYGDGWYESVDYSLLTVRDRNVLRVTPMEKVWGPDYLRLGVNLDTNFKQDSAYTLRAAYEKNWLNSLGGQLLAVGEIGRKTAASIDLYQPLEERQRYFLESSASSVKESLGIYQDNHKLADYEKSKRSLSLGLGVNVGLLGQLSGGWRQNWVAASLTTGVPSAVFRQEVTKSYGGEYLSLDFDQMDRLSFPTSGWASKVAYFNSANEGYSKLFAELRAAFGFKDLVLNAKVNFQGSPKGNLPSYDSGTLGGFFNLSGFSADQINGDTIRYAGLRAEKIVGRPPLGLRGDMRAGIALETAKVGTLYTETNRRGWLNSASIYVGGETPLGPAYIGYGRSSGGASSVYLFIGTP